MFETRRSPCGRLSLKTLSLLLLQPFFADKEFMELDKKRYDEALSTIDLIDAYRP